MLPPPSPDVVSPADSAINPPSPESLLPTITLTVPPRPPVADPLCSASHPLLPDPDVPLLSATLPDTPADNTFADANTTLPEPALVLEPLPTMTDPPSPVPPA